MSYEMIPLFNEVPEKMLEDWAERYMAPLIHPNADLLGRQVTLPSGRRIDLLFLHEVVGEYYLTVVELKVGEADMSAVIQCLDYVAEMELVGYSNVRVRGVVAAEDFSGDVRTVVRKMEGMALMDMAAYLSVTADALYDEAGAGPWTAKPVDVDRTRARDWRPARRSQQVAKVRKVFDDLNEELKQEREEARPHRERAKRRTALAPLGLDPRHVTYSNGNGRA